MANVLTTELAQGQTLEMPCNNLLATRMGVGADVNTLGGSLNQILFVDSVLGLATGATGSMGAKFQTIQAALTYAAAQAWTSVELLVSPAPVPYGGAFTVPLGLTTVIRGWDETGLMQPELAGAITIVGGVGSTTDVGFINCNISAATIAAQNPATQDISCSFDNSFNSASINAFNMVLQYRQSVQAGDVTAGGACNVRWDGPSWSYYLQVAPTVPAGINNLFFDAGHDTYARALAVNGVAIGATAFVALAVPPIYTQQNDRAQIQVVDPAIQDFICGVHGVGVAGTVTAWLTNLSRVSTNFNEAILLLMHHEQMVAEPPP